MYKKITHTIVEEHYDQLDVIPLSTKITGGMPPGWEDCDTPTPGSSCPQWMMPLPSNESQTK